MRAVRKWRVSNTSPLPKVSILQIVLAIRQPLKHENPVLRNPRALIAVEVACLTAETLKFCPVLPDRRFSSRLLSRVFKLESLRVSSLFRSRTTVLRTREVSAGVHVSLRDNCCCMRRIFFNPLISQLLSRITSQAPSVREG